MNTAPKPNLRILVLEDRADDAELMIIELERAGFAPDWCRVDSREAFCARLNPPPDVILADYSLPQFCALEALRLTRESGLDTPFIVVSGSVGEEIAVQAIKLGADDYLLKDRLARLGEAVRRALEQQRLRAEKRLADERIRAQLREKEILLKEVHHRVKNNLQVVSSLLNLQAAGLSDPKAIDALQDSVRRVRSMALIHETLCQTEDLARTDIERFVRQLATSLVGAVAPGEGATLHADIAHVMLPLDQAVPCALILHELITNALKHAAVPGSRAVLRVSLRANAAGLLELEVRDNGPGFAARDGETASGLGLSLVRYLAQQLAGQVEFVSGEGGCVRVAFPSASPTPPAEPTPAPSPSAPPRKALHD
jgi:two-component sensor histidine kinase/CheY-like chemotaxis protein